MHQCILLYLGMRDELATSSPGEIDALFFLCTVHQKRYCGHTNIIWSHSFLRKTQCPSVHSHSIVTSGLDRQLYSGSQSKRGKNPRYSGWPIGKGGMAKGDARRVAQVLEEASPLYAYGSPPSWPHRGLSAPRRGHRIRPRLVSRERLPAEIR